MNSELEQGLDTLDQRATLARIAIIIVIATSFLSLVAVVLLHIVNSVTRAQRSMNLADTFA